MKLKYFIPFFLTVVAAVFTSCSDDNDPTYFDEIRVSQSYVSLSTSGGSASIDIKTSGDWQFEKKFKVTTKDANGNNVDNYYETPEWLSVNQTSGGAGQSTLTFSAEAGEGRNAELLISCEGKTQHIYIIQGIASVSNATCAEVIAGPDSKTYRVTGTVTKIVNTTYGNWYLNDGTGEVYIYGTLDAKGAEKKDGARKAFRAYCDAIALRPQNLENYIEAAQLARVYDPEFRIQTAEILIRAVAHHPQSPRALDQLIAALRKTGNTKLSNAWDEYRRAIGQR